MVTRKVNIVGKLTKILPLLVNLVRICYHDIADEALILWKSTRLFIVMHLLVFSCGMGPSYNKRETKTETNQS